MRVSRVTVLAAVLLAGVLGWVFMPSVGEVQADPTKTRPCGTGECPVNERCCFLDPCSSAGACIPSFAKCPPPLPCEPPASAPLDSMAGQVCEEPGGLLH